MIRSTNSVTNGNIEESVQVANENGIDHAFKRITSVQGKYFLLIKINFLIYSL